MGKATILIDLEAVGSMFMIPPEYSVATISIRFSPGDGRSRLAIEVTSASLAETSDEHLISPVYEQVQAVRFVRMIV